MTTDPAVTAREISEEDFTQVANLLARGFHYQYSYFTQLLEEMSLRGAPDNCPKYGYALACGEKIVGAVLLISTRMEDGGETFIRCHVTSWFVEPAFRPLAALFFYRTLKRKDIAYINVSARDWTRPIIESQGFRRYSNGQVLIPTSLVALRWLTPGHKLVTSKEAPGDATDFERRLMVDHARYGCACVWCLEGDVAWPFVFHDLPLKRIIPAVQLVYCRDIDAFTRFAPLLGRYLLRRGKAIIRIDANGRMPNLPGVYCPEVDPRFCKGRQPRQGDLAYTQLAMRPFQRIKQSEGRSK